VRTALRDRQDALSELIEGYIRKVPEDCRENASDVAGGGFCSSSRGTEQGD